MNITARTKICMVIGDPVEDSLSPQLHNSGYEALSIDSDFVYVATLVTKANLKRFVETIRIMNLRGVSCKAPHKVTIMSYLDSIDAVAQQIGAVNTIVNDNGSLKGYNTDWLGIVKPLEQRIKLDGKKVALLGAGGAARSAAYGLAQSGCQLTIYNRTLKKAAALVEEFGGNANSLERLQKIQNADIIINAIPANHAPPSFLKYIVGGQLIFDMNYGPKAKYLSQLSKQKGVEVINGLEMLLHQGAAQFELYTGHEAPVKAMLQALLKAGANT